MIKDLKNVAPFCDQQLLVDNGVVVQGVKLFFVGTPDNRTKVSGGLSTIIFSSK